MKLTEVDQVLKVYLGAAKSTNDMTIALTFDIINQRTGEILSNTITFKTTNGTAHIALIGPPLDNQILELVECYIYNKDSATKDVYIEIVDTVGSYIIKKETALAVGGTLSYTSDRGWYNSVVAGGGGGGSGDLVSTNNLSDVANTNTSLNNLLPTQATNNGKVLGTDGSNTSWVTASGLPTQTGNNGKFLTTDGSSASWATITTLGTVTTGTWSATTVAVNKGGTGQTSYTDGQLLIGNTTGNTLAKATLTGTSNQVVVTNGSGTITLSIPQNIHTAATPTFASMTLSATASITLGTASTATGQILLKNSTNSNTITIQPGVTSTDKTYTWPITDGAVNTVVVTNASGVLSFAANIQACRITNAQTGTTYTLVLTDANKCITLSNAGAITLTVDTNANVAFPTGTEIDLVQLGAGQVTIAAAGGVTINSYQSHLKITGQYAGATLKKIGTDTWILVGNLSA